MFEDYEKILTKYINDPDQVNIDRYERNGGYKAFRKIVHELKPEQVTEEVKKSGLRGRGGAGSPAAWRAIGGRIPSSGLTLIGKVFD